MAQIIVSSTRFPFKHGPIGVYLLTKSTPRPYLWNFILLLSQLPDPLISRSQPLAQWRILVYHMVASFPNITSRLSLSHSECWPAEQPHLNHHEGNWNKWKFPPPGLNSGRSQHNWGVGSLWKSTTRHVNDWISPWGEKYLQVRDKKLASTPICLVLFPDRLL